MRPLCVRNDVARDARERRSSRDRLQRAPALLRIPLGWMSRSVRRVLFRVAVTSRAVTVIHLDRPLLTSSSALPAGSDGPPSNACAAPVREPLGLAPGGVYRATPVTRGAGGLLHHRFTLTPRWMRGAVCSLWHCPAGRPGLPLTTTLPCGVRTFLGGGPEATDAAARPTRPRRRLYRRRVHPPAKGR